MKGPTKYFLALIFIGLLILPNIALAELNLEEVIKQQDNIELKQGDTKDIFRTLIQKLKDEWMKLPTPEEQAILVILVEDLKVDVMKYLLAETGKDLLKSTVKLGYFLLSKDISFIIKEFEKFTVNEAKEYAMEWLLQNEIKVGKGNLVFSYPAYIGGWEQGVFPYVIVYHPLDLKRGEVVIEVYSSEVIKAPGANLKYQWEGGVEELRPFIVRVGGMVEKVDIAWGSVYRWVKGPEINIIFNEPVPEIEFEEQGFLDKKAAEIKSDLNKAKKVLGNFLDIFGKSGQVVKEKVEYILDKIGTIFSLFDLFGAKVSPDLGFFEEEEIGQIGQEEEEIEEIEEEEIIEEGIGGPKGLTLNEAQEIIDDIAERIDVLNQKVSQLLAEEAKQVLEEPAFAEATADKEEKIAEEPEQPEQPEIIVSRKGGGGAPPPPPTYPKILISEIQILLIEQRFIELYNPNAIPVSLTGWYVQRKTETGTSWDSLVSSTKFEGKFIQPQSHFLIARFNQNADIIIEDLTLAKNNVLILKNPNREIVDKLGWGEAQDYETAPTLNPEAGQSIGRKWIDGGYQDIDNNSLDFEIKVVLPAPEPESEPEPEPEPEQNIIETVTPSISPTIYINEIAWMGTEASSNDEWIELYNPNPEPVELPGWQLLFYPKEQTEPRITTFSIIDTATPSIAGFSYFLLERTSDDTISDIKADYVFKGALNDDGGVLELRDANSNLINRVDCSKEKWFAGDKDKKISMERIDSDNWASNNLIIRQGLDADNNKIWGTPRAKNSVSQSPTEIISSLLFDKFDKLTLSLLNSPYIIKGTLEIPENKALIIESGVIIKFYDKYSGIKIGGTLKATGTEDEKVVFTSFQDNPQTGDWDKLYFTETSIDSELDDVIIEYAGGGYGTPCNPEMAGIKVEKSSITLKNSVIKNNQYRGTYLIDSESLIDNTQFLNNITCSSGYGNEYGGIGLVIEGGAPFVENSIFEASKYPISIKNSSAVFSNNQVLNNDINGIMALDHISQNAIWQADLPYVIWGNINVFPDVFFEIKPGVTIKFYDNYSGLTVGGTLRANGVTFTSFQDNPQTGDWDKLYFTETSTNSELDDVIIEYAGGGYGTPCNPEMAGIKVEKSSITLKNSVIKHNQYHGIYLIESDSILDNVQIVDTPVCCKGCHNEYGGVGLEFYDGNSVLENLTFEANKCNISRDYQCIDPVPTP